MPGAQLGLNARFYIGDTFNPATIPTTWNVMNNVKDLVLDLSKGTADVTTRANNGYTAVIGTLKDANLKFTSVWDDSDDRFADLSDAFFDNTQVWVQVLDKDKTLAATTHTGLQAFMEVVGFTRNEQLTEGITVDFVLRPAFNLDNPPEWISVTNP